MNQTSAGNPTNQVMVRWARIATFVLIGVFAVFFYIEYAIRYFD